MQRAVKSAARTARLTTRATCHTLRHSFTPLRFVNLRFATHLSEAGTDVRTVQQLLGPTRLQTTMKTIRVLNRSSAGVKSPLDR